MVKDFVDCKHGRKPIEKMHPLVDELLVPTYGVIVYQEQVMQIAQQLAGYTLGGADLLRRAMGKKKPEEMAKQKATFVDGSRKNGVTAEDAERIFGLLEYFAGYGFNKSHSAAYALHHVPDGVPQGALPGGVPVRADDGRPRQDRQGRAHHRRGARVGRRDPPARDQRVARSDFTVVYDAPSRRRTASARPAPGAEARR